MNRLMSIKNYLLKPLLLGLLLLSFGFNSNAQRKESKSKNKKYKTTKVFYGVASFYSGKFNGRHTANGEIFSQKKFTCACNVLPLGTWIKVTNIKNKKFAIVKVNDRLHPKTKRIVDLTKADAVKLGFAASGVARVKVEVIGKKKMFKKK